MMLRNIFHFKSHFLWIIFLLSLFSIITVIMCLPTYIAFRNVKEILSAYDDFTIEIIDPRIEIEDHSRITITDEEDLERLSSMLKDNIRYRYPTMSDTINTPCLEIIVHHNNYWVLTLMIPLERTDRAVLFSPQGPSFYVSGCSPIFGYVCP